LYDEAIIKKTAVREDLGIQVGGECIHSVRFADDKAKLSNTAKGQQTLISKLNDVTEEYGINKKKTKVMLIAKKGNRKVKIIINGDEIEQVKQFRYLGSVITEDGRCEQEIKQELQWPKQHSTTEEHF